MVGQGNRQGQIGGELTVFDRVEGMRDPGAIRLASEQFRGEKMQVEVGPGVRQGGKGRDCLREFLWVIGDTDEDGKWVERFVAVPSEAKGSFPTCNFERAVHIHTPEILHPENVDDRLTGYRFKEGGDMRGCNLPFLLQFELMENDLPLSRRGCFHGDPDDGCASMFVNKGREGRHGHKTPKEGSD